MPMPRPRCDAESRAEFGHEGVHGGCDHMWGCAGGCTGSCNRAVLAHAGGGERGAPSLVWLACGFWISPPFACTSARC
eukprot:1313089-Amphidinium_carterae.1